METTRLLDAMLAAPAGRAFLLIALESGLPAEAIVEAGIARELSACALEAVNPWRSDRAEILERLLEPRSDMEALARTVFGLPAAAEWFSSLDPAQQVWFSADGEPPLQEAFQSPGPPSHWELYAQKCAGGLYTTTLVQETSALHAVLAYGTGDIAGKFHDALLTPFHLRLHPGVRVLEINGPWDWHALCLRFPARASDGRMTPDWSQVMSEWHGVHVTLGGVLLAEQVRTTSPEGWSQFGSWDFEQTLWLRWVVLQAQPLPDLPWPLERTAAIRVL